jgi:glycosyltransferase involved in cell wall biosynthesis
MVTSDLVPNCKDFPFITIAIPTFNRAALLRNCVALALAQTHRNFELLVSDNASTDETGDVLRQFTDARLRVLRQERNIGLLSNWNACLAAAKGDFFILLSDDDVIAPWMLERCIGVIRRDPQIPIVVTLSNLHSGSTGRTFPARTSRSLDSGIHDGSAILTEFLTDRITVTMSGIMMRTAVVRERGGLPVDFLHTADVVTWAPLLLQGNAGFVNEPCATFTYHSQSETARLGVEQLLRDGWKAANLIAYQANENIGDAQRRRMLQVQTRRCFARRGLMALSDYRKSGGGLQTLLNTIWRFRGHLSNVNMAAVMRFAAIVLCPHWIADLARRFKPTAPEQLVRTP